MSFFRHTLVLETREPIQFLDITNAVAQVVDEHGCRDGLVTVFSRHTTAAVRVQEAEPLLLKDFRDFLERTAPRNATYRHNDFCVRQENMVPEESPNGHSHCLHIMLGSSESVPIAAGRMLLGKWQRLFLIELDGPRPRREVLVQTIGFRAETHFETPER